MTASRMQSLGALDILALIVLVVSVGTAVSKGLTVELISLASTILGFVLALLFYQDVAYAFKDLGPFSYVSDFVGFLVVFLGVLLVGSAVSFTVDRALKKLYIKWIDRVLGGLFGLLRGGLICIVIFLVLTAFQIRRDLLKESLFAEFFLTGAHVLVVFGPEDLRRQFDHGYQWLYDRWLEQTREAYEG